jgi:manganese/zinc/iron transport system substrate-binding protein
MNESMTVVGLQTGSPPRRGVLRAVAMMLAGVVSLAACGGIETIAIAGEREPLKVVATIGMLGDAARQIAGDRANVTSLMNEGVDPHTYKPTPGDVRAMSGADVILYNGLHLEGRMADVIVRMAGRRSVVRATETIDESLLREPAEFAGHFDPHVWFDVSLWKSVVGRVRDALIEKDPAGKEAYALAASEYLLLLDELHAYAKASIASIPEKNRVLVTAHDAFGYFGRAYGLEVLAIQGISTDSEASLQDINALVDTLVARKVPAVFIESSVPRKTIDALIEGCKGRGHTVRVGGELFSDALGRKGTAAGTYVGMVLHNVEAVTRALGGTIPDARPVRLSAYMARFETSPTPTRVNTPASAAPSEKP